MLSLLLLCSAAAHALKFEGGISLSQLKTPALLVDVDELPSGGVDALQKKKWSDMPRLAEGSLRAMVRSSAAQA